MNAQDIITKVGGFVVAGIGSAGFVTAIGGAVLWTRFQSSELPADQAVAAVPKEELVVVGASTLVTFVILGLVAVIGVHALDRNGCASRGTRLGLIALLVVEVAIAIGVGQFKYPWLIMVLFAFAGVLAVQVVEEAARLLGADEDDAGPPPRRRRPLAIASAVVLGLGAIYLARHERSLALETGAAALLALMNLGAAKATGSTFAFYGVAVFLSVIMFGGVVSIIRTEDNPKLQPIAVLVSEEDGSRAECGLYVTESKDRLYMARVDFEPRGRRTVRVRPKSGRMFWLPRAKLVRSEIGPLQGVEDAQDRAADLREELLRDRPPPASGKSAPVTPLTDDPAEREALEANRCLPKQPPVALRKTDERKLARKFQPRLIIDRADKFWPVSALTMFKLRHGNRGTCRQVSDVDCVRTFRASDLPWVGGTGEWLEFPGSHTDVDEQHADMTRALGNADPTRSAREYFFSTGGAGQPTSIQYWFYYQFNYQRLGVGGVKLGTGGFHEGDFEMTGLLLNTEADPRPVYVWTARHGNEGRPLLWSESQLNRAGDHLSLYSARGSHATYDSCATQNRDQAPLGLINDRPQCDPTRQLILEPSITPLSDLAYAPWVCWGGRFGNSARRRIPGTNDVFARGPESPLYQQDFDRKFNPCQRVTPPGVRPDAGEEVLPDTTGAALRRAGGRLDGLFDGCDDWMKRPPSGIYVVACDQRALTEFFKSGLRDRRQAGITISAADGKVEPPGVPSVLRRPDGADAEGVTLRTAAPTTARVYAVCYRGSRAIVAEFPAVQLVPGRRHVLRTSGSRWTLEGGTTPAEATPKTSGDTTRCDRRPG